MERDRGRPLVSYIEDAPFELQPKRIDGRFLRRKSVEDDKVLNVSSLANNSVTNPMLQDDIVKQAELDTEIVSVTVSAGAASGTATVTSGSVVIGWRPTGNNDQFVDNISVSGTTLTITLAANATADNTFSVILLKA